MQYNKASRIEDALHASDGDQVTLHGWVSSQSRIGGLFFVILRDGTGYLQLAARKGVTSNDAIEAISRVTIESAVSVFGSVTDDSRAPGGKEIQVLDFNIVSLAEKWPITKSAVKSTSYLYDNRHLSIRGKKSIAIMRIRASMIRESFNFFINHGYTLITAPTLVQSGCEGGSTLFKLEYFGQEAYLTQSAQLYEEAAICSFEKVFVIQPAFRAEKSKTTKHLTEFWMIEAEQAFAGQDENLSVQEEYLSHILGKIVDLNYKELETLGRKFSIIDPPYPRISYDEIWNRASKKGIGFEWGADIPSNVEKMISVDAEAPVFITDYPALSRGFYHKTKDDNDKLTLSADLIATEGYGEIATGGQREDNYDALIQRIQNQELPVESFQWYLDLRRYGLPPHSGFGIGVERVVRWICGLKNIRSASLFPRTMTRITP